MSAVADHREIVHRQFEAAVGSGHRMRITATVGLSADPGEADMQRGKIAAEFARFAQRIRNDYGVSIEAVVGKPRSPDELRAAVEALT